MSFLDWLQRRRLWLEEDLDGSERRWSFSPTLHLVRQTLVPLLVERVRGATLDVGCGRMPYLPYLSAAQAEHYDGLDIEARSPKTRYLCDAQDMRDVPDASYDTILAFSALEHVPDPAAALRSMRRVARPGATLILMVPFLSRLHEEPHDYYRFTQYSLKTLADAAAFEVESIEPVGGLFAFLAHQVSTLFVCMFWRVPVLQDIAFFLNKLLFVRLPIALDDALNTGRKFPNNYLAILRVPE